MGAPAFDNAPVASPPVSEPKDRVQFIYPYYENPKFLEAQMELWSSYSDSLRERLEVIAVDDGSPDTPAANIFKGYPLNFKMRLFRIGVDVRWNWLAARNIGMHHAHEGWCLLTDMDHMVTEEALRTVLYREHDPEIIYRFNRMEKGKLIHSHPNSMLMTRATFWKVGGYDERLSGFYGTDGDWRRRCAEAAPIRTLMVALERHEYVGDSSTTRYLRKQPQDAGKKKIIQARRLFKNWRPKVLSFPYEEIARA